MIQVLLFKLYYDVLKSVFNSISIFYLYFDIVATIIKESILRPPPSGSRPRCPDGTFDGQNTCFCEDHCSWETCRLQKPPHSCLSGTREAVWAWDAERYAWVAQGNSFQLLIVAVQKWKNGIIKK